MPNLNMKKLILIIVEGISDKAYLYPVKKIVKLYSNNKVEFKITRCDMLVQSDTDYTNIEIKVGVAIQEYLEEYHLDYNDVKQVIHIIDLDGAFIDEKNVESNSSLLRGETIYYRDKIVNVNKRNIIARNKKKVDCLNVLFKLDKINYGTKGTLPYRIYYFSTNIDDYFFGKQNLSNDEKKANSNLISDLYIDNPEGYRTLIEDNYCTLGSYIETWEYVKKGNNSLSRCTNFNKFFTEIVDKF